VGFCRVDTPASPNHQLHPVIGEAPSIDKSVKLTVSSVPTLVVLASKSALGMLPPSNSNLTKSISALFQGTLFESGSMIRDQAVPRFVGTSNASV